MNVPEKHRAIAHAWVDGAKVEVRYLKGTLPTPEEWAICWKPSWHEDDWEYRIALTKPSINWEHVAPEYVALAMDENGRCALYKSMPTVREGDSVWQAADMLHRYADTFASLEKGTCDWKDSLVLRPSADSEKDAAPSPTTAHTHTPKLEWSKTLASGKRVTFAEAEKAVAELGEGWRLPTRQELESILDLSRHTPCIDTEEFPDTQCELHWSSSPCAWNTSAHWVVGLSLGTVLDFGVSDNACVRAVREGAAQ